MIHNTKSHGDINMGDLRKYLFFFVVAALINTSLIIADFSTKSFRHDKLKEMQLLKARHFSSSSRLQQSSPPPSEISGPVVYHVTAYGADPTGQTDSTDAILHAITDALNGPGKGFLFNGILNLGGARVDLDGGNYLISRPLRFPVIGKGNLVIHGGSLTASNEFPTDGYLIDLSPASNSDSEYYYEFITLRDLLLDANFKCGGIRVVKSLRTSIDNAYITHFATTGIAVEGGHETYVRYSYLGQRATAGGDPAERSYSGTGIILAGNDNSVTEVVIFSAQTGIIISGQANLISGVHCYNKAIEFGGTGIYIKVPNLTQTRIVDSYMDYTGIVAEDPVHLTIANSLFLGDAFVLFKSIKGVMSGVEVSGNSFSGSDKGVEIVQMEGAFHTADQIFIDRNTVKGMKMKTTVARASVEGRGTSWTADFKSLLFFPDGIKQVHYSFITEGSSVFPLHGLRNVSDNRVVIHSDVAVPATVYITVDQGPTYHY